MAADGSNAPGGSHPVETNILRIHAWRALRHRRCEHVGGMDFGCAAGDKDKPHTLGHHGNSFRRGWIDLAAVSAEEGPCRRSPWVAGTSSNSVGWRADGACFLWWSGIRTVSSAA